jgi:hypothetical protein
MSRLLRYRQFESLWQVNFPAMTAIVVGAVGLAMVVQLAVVAAAEMQSVRTFPAQGHELQERLRAPAFFACVTLVTACIALSTWLLLRSHSPQARWAALAIGLLPSHITSLWVLQLLVGSRSDAAYPEAVLAVISAFLIAAGPVVAGTAFLRLTSTFPEPISSIVPKQSLGPIHRAACSAPATVLLLASAVLLGVAVATRTERGVGVFVILLWTTVAFGLANIDLIHKWGSARQRSAVVWIRRGWASCLISLALGSVFTIATFASVSANSPPWVVRSATSAALAATWVALMSLVVGLAVAVLIRGAFWGEAAISQAMLFTVGGGLLVFTYGMLEEVVSNSIREMLGISSGVASVATAAGLAMILGWAFHRLAQKVRLRVVESTRE